MRIIENILVYIAFNFVYAHKNTNVTEVTYNFLRTLTTVQRPDSGGRSRGLTGWRRRRKFDLSLILGRGAYTTFRDVTNAITNGIHI